MITAFATLLGFQLIGEIIVRAVGLPVPGPVAGMALLFVALVVRGRVPEDLRATTAGILQNLTVLFVPAGTGVMVHFGRIGAEWPGIVTALLASTVATIAVTALVMKGVKALTTGRQPETTPPETKPPETTQPETTQPEMKP